MGFDNFPTRWKQYELGDLLSYEQPTPFIVESTNYCDDYETPVLTAGKTFIIGYTDEKDGIYESLPVIIFDDFTTASQYVNFKFKVKSSAMKILTADADKALTKFLYYMMQIIDCKHDTHKRYWIQTYSKIKVSIPTIPEQERIVVKIEELFSELDKSIEALQKVKAQLKVYRQAVLKDAFEPFKKFISIREVTTLVTSGSRGWAKYYANNGAKFIRIGNLTRDRISIDYSDIQYVSLPRKAEGIRSLLCEGDILVSITADLGSIGLIESNIGEAYINQHIALVRFKNSVQSKFFAWYLRSEKGQCDLLRNKRGGGKLGLGLDDIRDARVPLISDGEAIQTINMIDERLSVCDKIEQIINETLRKTDSLRHSILKKAFEGQLFN